MTLNNIILDTLYIKKKKLRSIWCLLLTLVYLKLNVFLFLESKFYPFMILCLKN